MGKKGSGVKQQESQTGNKEARRVVVPTGLHLLEEGGGRSLALYACITVRSESIIAPEVNATFFADSADAAGWTEKATCGDCREIHEFFSLLDALEEGDILPMDLTDGACAVGVDIPVLVAQVVRWLRTPKPRALDRKAS